MTIQYSATLRNNQLDAFETTIGTAPKLQIRSGTVPADCATAASGTLLAELTLPSDFMNAASAGAKTKAGTWAGTGSAAGTASHFRVLDSTGATCHTQGTCTATGGGGDMILDNTSIAIGQTFTVNTFTINAGNA